MSSLPSCPGSVAQWIHSSISISRHCINWYRHWMGGSVGGRMDGCDQHYTGFLLLWTFYTVSTFFKGSEKYNIKSHPGTWKINLQRMKTICSNLTVQKNLRKRVMLPVTIMHDRWGFLTVSIFPQTIATKWALTCKCGNIFYVLYW